jgi:serine protease
LRLTEEPDIQYAEPNSIAESQMMPNNPAYSAGYQWDMSMMNLPTAWEMTTGDASVIVAVLDTGIRSHPNLDPNILTTGYNFVDMNSDPTEPLAPNAEFHGTHVAGTIASIGNTGSGIAGVAWNVKIMPVRVLGEAFGGTETMIINGMLYAAGLPNSSGTTPPQRANVINMSLGGQGTCSQAYQDAVNQVINAGVTIVVAAGNDAENGNPVKTPASCQGVIAVGALDPAGNKASYSESQPYVFISAPGGEMIEGIHAGVLSTLPISTAGGPYYKFMQGTSMATPHISGVIALMNAVNSSLTSTQIKTILATTANTLNMTVPNNNVGYGLVDAGKAVAAAKGVTIPAVPVPYPYPSLVNFQQITTAMNTTADIISMGASTLVISGGTITVLNPSGGTWLSAVLGPSCSEIAPASYCPLTINVDPTGLPNGQYTGIITLNTNGGDFGIPVLFQVGATPIQAISDPITVQLWSFDPIALDFTNLVATTTTDVSQNYNYTFQSVPVGNNYVVVAGVDTNGDGVFGDYFGEVFTVSGMHQINVVAGQATIANTLNMLNEQNDIVNGI